jgi:hypothetical protein
MTTWWWLAFSEPEQQKVLGVVLVEGASLREALTRMIHILRIEPGGQLTAEEFAQGVAPPEAYRDRVLTYGEAAACAEEMNSRYRGEEGRAA